MAIGQPEPETIDIIDWHALYNHTDTDEQPIIEDLAFRGRWTAIAAAAKAGKSTILLALAVDTAATGIITIYLDAEMGRGDVLERVEDWMELKPADLTNLHYTDLPPKLDTVQGAQRLYNTACTLNADLIVIDGLNGVVNGAENDDTPWRDMYEWAIHPLKARGLAVISTDNMGHGERKGPRGSSVKLDKADAIIALERTDTGVKLTATHRRSAAYPTTQEYTVTNADETGPPMKVIRVGAGTGAPAGTNQIIALLDELDAPIDISRRKARELLKDNGHEAPRNAELGAMLKWWRLQADPFTSVVPRSPGPVGTNVTTPLKVVPNIGDHSQGTPGRRVVPDRGSPKGPPPVETEKNSGTTHPPKQDHENPF